MAVPNSVFRPFNEKLGDTDRATFVGNEGDLFYDPEVAALYISDGSTPGGIQIGGGGGGSITGVTAGDQLNGGGTSGNVTLNLNSDIAVGVLTATTIGGSLIPGDPSYNLGSAANPWNELFVSNNSIFIGLASITATADNNISLGQTVYIGEAELTSMEGSNSIGFGSVSEMDLGDLELFGSPAAVDFVTEGTVQGKDGTGPGVRLNLYGGTSTDGQGGGQIVIESGFSVGSGTGGLVTIKSGEGATSGNIEIETGDADNTGNLIIQTGEANGVAGTIFLRGGEQQSSNSASDILISGGTNIGSGDGGSVLISGGSATGVGSTGAVFLTDINQASVNADYLVIEDTDLATKKYVDDNAGGGGVTQLVAGSGGIVVDPSSGVGVVTISLANSPITALAAGNNITLEPANGQPGPTGVVTITASGGATPGGSTRQIQYNDNGTFGGSAGLTFDGTNTLTVANIEAGDNNQLLLKSSDHLLERSGSVQLRTGNASIAPSGDILIEPGTSGGSSGVVGVTTISGGQGTSDSLRGGEVTIKGGDGDYGGDVTIEGGAASSGDADQSKTGRVFINNPILNGINNQNGIIFDYEATITSSGVLYVDVAPNNAAEWGAAKIYLTGVVDSGTSNSRQFVEVAAVKFGSTFVTAETHNIKAPAAGQTIFTYSIDDGSTGGDRFQVNITNASGQSSIKVSMTAVRQSV